MVLGDVLGFGESDLFEDGWFRILILILVDTLSLSKFSDREFNLFICIFASLEYSLSC